MFGFIMSVSEPGVEISNLFSGYLGLSDGIQLWDIYLDFTIRDSAVGFCLTGGYIDEIEVCDSSSDQIWVFNKNNRLSTSDLCFGSFGNLRPQSDASTCLDGSGVANGHVLNYAPCNKKPGQQWIVNPSKTNRIITNVQSNLCLDVGPIINNTDIVVGDFLLLATECEQGAYQNWVYHQGFILYNLDLGYIVCRNSSFGMTSGID
ncbi:hypothetical protein HK100_000014 [Physocladia obscura]|uniref:Ricin B lectin domain-containing protein n=1 Tax=Physocladia obscura TaxID=109957 RepID=A0AAD5TC13_9FUNG|nr:hypothetical protein HK100_000014 [Physocladia obscura]